MRKFIVISFFLLKANALLVAQDIHFSQYQFNPLNLSPSSTGFFNGDRRANMAYRNQWNSVTVPYTTFSFGYDQVIGKVHDSGNRNAAGLLFNNDKAGDGNLGTLQLMLSFAHLFSLGTDSIHFINVGIQSGFSYKSIDINKLTFDNQFNGDVFNPLQSTGEQFARVNYIYPELNAGISWMALYDNTIYNATIGTQHLNKPELSFLNETAKLPLHWQFNASAVFGVHDFISFSPSIIYTTQQKFKEINTGIELKFNLKKDAARNYAFAAACNYRVKDAVIPCIALYYNQWRVGVSYDINTSDLKRASNGRGGPEFNVMYIMKKIRYIPRKNNCPVY